MTALAVALTFMVLLLTILVLGLLRSHADILRALHSLGAGIGDPVDDEAPSRSVPITMGPTLPAERRGHAPDLVGTTVGGDARAMSMTAADLTGSKLQRSNLDRIRGAESFRGVTIGSDQITPTALAVFSAMGIAIDDE